MGSVWLGVHAQLRIRWRAMAGLALLLGVIGGLILSAAAGARRTDTAFPRLLQWANAAQVDIVPGSSGPTPGYFAAVARLPQVTSMSTAVQYNVVLPMRPGLPLVDVETFASPDRALGVSVDRVKILQGRMFNPDAPGEAVIDQQLAGLQHLRPGGTLHLLGVRNNPRTGRPDLQLAVPLAFRVAAVVVFDNQIVPTTRTNGLPMALLSPPFSAAPAAASVTYGTQAAVRLRPGASLAAFVRAASMLTKRYPATGGSLDVVNMSDEVTATERAVHPEAVALGAFAALAGLFALAVIGQLLGRQLTLDAIEFPILRVLGMTRAALLTLSLARMAVVTVAGGVIAVAVAIAASPLMPIGPARLAEPSPGIEVNLAILAPGLAALAVLPLAAIVPAAWRAATRARGPLGTAEPAVASRASRLGSALSVAGSITGGVGVRMALEPGRGRTAVPVRSALVGITVAITAVVAAVVFGTSLIALVSTPHRYGQNWDQELDLEFAGVPAPFGAKVLSAEPAVTGYAAGDYGQLSIKGKNVAAVGISSVRGTGFLTLLAGRPASGPGEIVLGAQTMRTLHSRLGQTVRVVVNQVDGTPGSAAAQRVMRVVGVAVFPSFGLSGLGATDLGNGAEVAARLLSAPSPSTGCDGAATCYNFFLIRYRAGTNLHAAAASLTAAVIAKGCPPIGCSVTSDQRPGDIQNYAGARDTPLVLSAVLGLLAVGTLTHVLITAVRRRRRDLAVLKTLGFSRSQLLRVVCWQASILAAAALIVALPLGIAAGRWAWTLFAGSVGVAPQADVPVPLVLAAIVVVPLLANLVAAGPGVAAARLRPAIILRSE
jgi:ABC-type antimicrobial peptide transport system permease subunit